MSQIPLQVLAMEKTVEWNFDSRSAPFSFPRDITKMSLICEDIKRVTDGIVSARQKDEETSRERDGTDEFPFSSLLYKSLDREMRSNVRKTKDQILLNENIQNLGI